MNFGLRRTEPGAAWPWWSMNVSRASRRSPPSTWVGMSAIPPPRDWSTLADFVRTAGPTSAVIVYGAYAGMSPGALLLLAIG